MTKETRKQNKAVKKLDKAVRKAVDKGLSQTVVENTVDSAITKAAKKVPAKKSGVIKDDEPDAELVTSRPPKKSEAKEKTYPQGRRSRTRAAMVGGRSGGRAKCQTRLIVWRAGGACPNGRKRSDLWAVHRSGSKWVQGARSASSPLSWACRVSL
jgi:hypothetical protein